MDNLTVIAVFPTHEDSLHAVQLLHERNLATSSITMPAPCMLDVTANDRDHERVREVLAEAGALEVTVHAAQSAPGWMSHQNGAVTGAGVPPGAGDAEAGAPMNRPPVAGGSARKRRGY